MTASVKDQSQDQTRGDDSDLKVLVEEFSGSNGQYYGSQFTRIGNSPGLRGPLTGPPRFSDLFGSVFVDYGSGACRLLS